MIERNVLLWCDGIAKDEDILKEQMHILLSTDTAEQGDASFTLMSKQVKGQRKYNKKIFVSRENQEQI